jgi:hypothetical protein
MMDTYDIYVWPDEWWCYAKDLSEYSHKSDDCQVLKIPENFDEESIELVIVFLKVNGRL